MVDKKLRSALQALGEERELEIALMDSPSFDSSIVGITDDGRLAYSYSSMVLELQKDENLDPEAAIEFIDYNTIRALPYMGENAPIILDLTKDELLDLYGDNEEQSSNEGEKEPLE